jgi:hypothetical protein
MPSISWQVRICVRSSSRPALNMKTIPLPKGGGHAFGRAVKVALRFTSRIRGDTALRQRRSQSRKPRRIRKKVADSDSKNGMQEGRFSARQSIKLEPHGDCKGKWKFFFTDSSAILSIIPANARPIDTHGRRGCKGGPESPHFGADRV